MKNILLLISLFICLKAMGQVNQGDPINATDINKIQNYSTTEILTGGKWVDGKPVYRLCLNGFSANANNTVLITGKNIENLVKVYGNYTYSSGRRIVFPYMGPDYYFVNVDLNTGEIYLTAKDYYNTDGVDQKIYACFEYTKSTD